MHLKRFRGKKLPDVMRRVREELGPEAVILHTKSAPAPGLLRFVHGAAVEVLAAVDYPGTAPVSPERRPPRPPAPPASAVRPGPDRDDLQAEVAEIKNLLVRLGGGRLLPPAIAPLHKQLLEAGVDDALALRLAAELLETDGRGPGSTPAALHARLADSVSGMIRVAAPPLTARTATVALVGPTGAGKTTTLAKLAARAHLGGGAVQILACDGTGLGTTGPLEALARMLGVPYTPALTAEAVARAVERSPARGLVLIDTPGLSRQDASSVAQTSELLRAARCTETHLVLSATSKTTDSLLALRAAAGLAITHLLFTRLDETGSCGSLLSVCVEGGLPLSYFGTGREVPHDLRPATADELARRALGTCEADLGHHGEESP